MFSDLVLLCLCGARRGFHYCLLAWSQGTELKGEALRYRSDEVKSQDAEVTLTRCFSKSHKMSQGVRSFMFFRASSTLCKNHELRGSKVVFFGDIVNICELNKLGVPLSGVPSGFSLYPLYMSTTGVICKLPSKAVRTLCMRLLILLYVHVDPASN